MADEAPFGRSYLQRRIIDEFALARHMNIVVEQADDTGLVLTAPLAQNANFKGTAFGGSLFSVAVLTGWAWVTRHLDSANLAADAVIQESTIRYVAPVHGALHASLIVPATGEIEKFRRMMQRSGRGRIRLAVQIRIPTAVACEFEGVFAAALR